MTYFIGQLVIIQRNVIGRIERIDSDGIWVMPLVQGSAPAGSCYDPKNVRPLPFGVQA